eukprot:CAMPEP_0170745434 /NCGR_PEP_ID=MMETSP0437-20130122/8291_1 /TAXON_ID=0 /ORGANISM="Sexangularia sp." /LENGTH=364 /DNA_ID=CAMNT_0011084153 /DNA_START=97 /DNA_END=1191 /DNA_ORIENTATION=+
MDVIAAQQPREYAHVAVRLGGNGEVDGTGTDVVEENDKRSVSDDYEVSSDSSAAVEVQRTCRNFIGMPKTGTSWAGQTVTRYSCALEQLSKGDCDAITKLSWGHVKSGNINLETAEAVLDEQVQGDDNWRRRQSEDALLVYDRAPVFNHVRIDAPRPHPNNEWQHYHSYCKDPTTNPWFTQLGQPQVQAYDDAMADVHQRFSHFVGLRRACSLVIMTRHPLDQLISAAHYFSFNHSQLGEPDSHATHHFCAIMSYHRALAAALDEQADTRVLLMSYEQLYYEGAPLTLRMADAYDYPLNQEAAEEVYAALDARSNYGGMKSGPLHEVLRKAQPGQRFTEFDAATRTRAAEVMTALYPARFLALV